MGENEGDLDSSSRVWKFIVSVHFSIQISLRPDTFSTGIGKFVPICLCGNSTWSQIWSFIQRYPTGREFIVQTVLAINHGARGTLYNATHQLLILTVMKVSYPGRILPHQKLKNLRPHWPSRSPESHHTSLTRRASSTAFLPTTTST